MSFITQWMTQIILVILFAIILELLLPSNSFQKYVKMVIGLILIITLLTPVTKLLNVDINQTIRTIANKNSGTEMKNSMKKQESEILGAQSAYIHNYMDVQMKKSVKEALVDQYGLVIKDLHLTIKKGKEGQNPWTIEKADVIVGQAKKGKAEATDKQEVKPVEEVNININDEKTSTPAQKDKPMKKKEKEVRAFLAEKWGVDQSRIIVQMEGG
ncbi:stage III sporulation protein AF [Scopulibacillus darangshiensis]|uniref:Stage III sporulation protein AF n=1 Tax=Scopulibacillus darangshiensis TaxID=442528 RepID=A0A4R2P9Z9_9BACL|nr:stage III sporulation protein AF [Scopulibacillus darangshiensis]TCP31178.1 stage III sporulation protein AF [Scopulibacillus darangshiensis]